MMTLAEIKNTLPPSCRILAVSKLQPVEAIRRLAGQGQLDFGENYAQEANDKQNVLRDLPLDWHFIGGLQKNKAKDVVGHFEWIHSVDSLSLAQVLSKKAVEKGVRQKVFLQMNLSHEPTKGGFSREQFEKDWKPLSQLQGLEMRGLMTMPPLFDDPSQARPYFRELRELRDQMMKTRPAFDQLSMGTSHDYRIAAEEGATWVRLGTVLFGERPRG